MDRGVPDSPAPPIRPLDAGWGPVWRRFGFFIGYGLLPFWGAWAVVLAGSLLSRSAEYWAVAPWLIILSLPVCGATLLISAVTLGLHGSGEQPSRRAAARKWFIALNLLLLAAGAAWWLSGAMVKRDIATEKERVVRFVRDQPAVIDAHGADARLSISSYKTDARHRLPFAYEVAIEGRPSGSGSRRTRAWAIVTVHESAGRRDYGLRCITAIQPGDRDSRDPCRL